MSAPAPSLEARDLTFAYGRAPVLDGIDLRLSRGELVGLIGPNGSGKTTLMHLLLGLLTPSRGTVLLDGAPVAGLPRRHIARRISLVPQETWFGFAFLVREVVAMGRTPYLGRFRAETAADLAAIAHALAATETAELAERPVTELSGGERQRVLIARALAQETPILLLDEPIANLDLAHQLETLDLIRGLVDRSGHGAIAALHDLSLAARYCDRLCLLSGGRIVAEGPPEAVLTAANLAAHFGVQARVERHPEDGLLSVVPLAPIGGAPAGADTIGPR